MHYDCPPADHQVSCYLAFLCTPYLALLCFLPPCSPSILPSSLLLFGSLPPSVRRSLSWPHHRQPDDLLGGRHANKGSCNWNNEIKPNMGRLYLLDTQGKGATRGTDLGDGRCGWGRWTRGHVRHTAGGQAQAEGPINLSCYLGFKGRGENIYKSIISICFVCHCVACPTPAL